MHSGGDGWPTFFLLFTLLRDDGDDDVDVDESAPLPPSCYSFSFLFYYLLSFCSALSFKK